MVHDPRVSSCLARLGGVYHDPGRVDRDASALLKSPVGDNLVPIVAEYYESRTKRTSTTTGRGTGGGGPIKVLVLQGTIAIHFRGQTYQILMDQYLPPGYPGRPPVPYVRLAPDMYLKENHQHVGSDGQVYLPYLNQWRANTHNLIELVVAMSSVFSADPPVFTRRAGSRPPPPRPDTDFATPMDVVAAAGGAMLSDEEAIAAVEAQEAMERAEAEKRQREEEQRRLDEERENIRVIEQQQQRLLAEERETLRALEKQQQWERERTERVRVQVTAKIRHHLQERARQTHQKIAVDLAREHAQLQLAQEHKIKASISALKEQNATLEHELAIAEEAKVDIELWVDEMTALQQGPQDGSSQPEISIDEKVHPERPLHAQMMELSAENAAITDALYFVDQAMHQGSLPCEVHLRQVRQLAKRQFLVRAHLLKISNKLVLARS